MFNLFGRKDPYIPLTEELRNYFQSNLMWLCQEFSESAIENCRVLTPTIQDFPIKWDNSVANGMAVVEIACENMKIDIHELDITFFSNGIQSIDTGISSIFIQQENETPVPIGKYEDKTLEGKFLISLDESLLKTPDSFVATVAHELAHVKLLGENRIDENDEMLTDLTTVYFGFGIFNANDVFRFYNQYDSWGYSKSGYLELEEWSYSLALFSHLRREENPEWVKFLNPSIKKEYYKCREYIKINQNSIF